MIGTPSLLALVVLTVLGGCAHSPHDQVPAQGPAPFSQTVPGSTVTFLMQPIGAAFWIGQTEVTWDAYDVFLLRLDIPREQRATAAADPGADAVSRPTPPYSPPDRGWGHEGYPALGITYNAAQQYCRWLSGKTGRHFRLPTVVEWQRAGCTVPGSTSPATAPIHLDQQAWCAENADEKSHPVATKPPNAFDLHDMLGNVAEWCTDADGKPVVCGGSFQTPAAELNCDLIERQTPAWNASDGAFPKSKWWLSDGAFVGFRVVCDASDTLGEQSLRRP